MSQQHQQPGWEVYRAARDADRPDHGEREDHCGICGSGDLVFSEIENEATHIKIQCGVCGYAYIREPQQ